jgi:hypothetical protein
MSDKRKTAVEILMEKLTYDNGFGQRWTSFTECTDLSSFFEEAKQIEREQIEEAYKHGLTAHPNDFTKSNEYYDQTYGKHE